MPSSVDAPGCLEQVGYRCSGVGRGGRDARALVGDQFGAVPELYPRATVEIFNDSDQTVGVWQCDNEDCEHGFGSEAVLRPGEHFDHAPVSVVGVPNPWLVVARDGKTRLGCLPLVFPKMRHGVIARVSEKVTCRRSYDSKVPWPPVTT